MFGFFYNKLDVSALNKFVYISDMEYKVSTLNKTIEIISGNVNDLGEIMERFKDYAIVSSQMTISYPLSPITYYGTIPCTGDVSTADYPNANCTTSN